MGAFPTLVLAATARLIRHPLVPAALALSAAWSLIPAVRDSSLMASAPGTPLNVFLVLTHVPSMPLGVAVLFAANLLATRDRRAGTAELLAAVPVPLRRRTAAALLAVLAPAVLTGCFTAVQMIIFHRYGPQPARWPSLGELAVQPATVLGGGLLGVAVARLAPWPGAAAATLAGLVGAFTLPASAGRQELLSLAPWREMAVQDDAGVVSYLPGSPGWHAAYLCCLGGLAAIAALLATPGPRRHLLLSAAVAVTATVVTGCAQFG
ncbi:hypothetical protein [Catenuloplanes japonicus]|uniref:hypothetical protein n=1 Tax=Catenuloplanes japonicus TaxID=33876 RepID=UPI0005266187|nr:hypothetical protein [Catenuloplanes japonicus]